MEIIEPFSWIDNYEYTPEQVLSTISDITGFCSALIEIDELTRIVDVSSPSFAEGHFNKMFLMLNKSYQQKKESLSEKEALKKLMKYANANSVTYVNGAWDLEWEWE